MPQRAAHPEIRCRATAVSMEDSVTMTKPKQSKKVHSAAHSSTSQAPNGSQSSIEQDSRSEAQVATQEEEMTEMGVTAPEKEKELSTSDDKKERDASTNQSIDARELEEQNLRLRAEFANFKRRIEREQSELAEYLKGEIYKNLLPILDDFKSMIEKSSSTENEASILEGAKLILNKLNQLLKDEGISQVRALGERFDPQLHEALLMQPIENAADHDRIIKVFQEGYRLNERLLRPSRVVVGKYEGKKE